MEAVLESVISGQILLKDFTLWLDTNKSDVELLNVINNYEFIPYFINYVKENCSWLLNKSDVQSEIDSADEISLQKPKFSPNHQQVQVYLNKGFCRNNLDAHKVSTPLERSPQIAYSTKTNSIQASGVKENANQKVILTFGCAPYQPKHREFRPFKENLQNAKFRNMNNYVPFSPTDSKTTGNSDINNLDAFPPLGGKVEDSKAKRRITPTPVQAARNSSSNFGKSPFTSLPANKVQSAAFRNSAFQDASFDMQHERDLLKLAREKLVIPSPASKTEPKAVDSNISKVKASPLPIVIPDPEKILLKEKVSIVAEIYNFLITKALIPNITSELYFMFELIIAKVTAKDEPKAKNLFSSIHNCVYFGVLVLKQQSHLLYMLDNTTLASLCEISYLSQFSSQFVSILQQSLVKQETSVSLPSLTRVPFQLDDDSRLNFSDETSFINFKKQRDLFYELLRDWQGQSMQCMDNKYQDKFAHKAKLLINLGPNTLNMYHLARLFQSQLIASCMCFEVNEVYDEVVSDIQKNFPAKFKKLQERFLTPTRVGGLTPPPSFYGVQSFFSELIVAAASPSLNQHLKDSFVSKILELDDTDIFSDGELSLFGTLKDKYIFLLHTLRLLGKFLGFIHFLPYSSKQSIPLKVAEFHVEARKCAIPPLDLPHLLKKAAQHSHIILTVPWVVEYLSMMDSLALNLQHIQVTLSILTDIKKWNDFPSKDLNSVLFLRLLIGWLFDTLHYPSKYSMLLQPVTFHCSQKILKKGIDTVSMIDKQLIHSCCPYLIEFKVLVFNYLNDVRNKREVRKITPITTTQTSLSSTNTKQQMESELEENFFALHPQSLKKTSDFIAERMTSKAIGKIRLEVTNAKLSIVNDIVSSDAYKTISESNKTISEKKFDIYKLLDASILGTYDSIRYKVRDIIEGVRNDIEKTIPVLLSDDTKQSVVDMCCKISFQMATNKISDWCDSNLLIDAIKSDVKSKVKHVFDDEPDIVTEKDLNLSQLLSDCREIILKVHSRSENVDTEKFLNLIAELSDMLAEETSKLVKKTIIMLSIDLFIALISYYPETCCEKLTESFLLLWSTCPTKLINEKLFLCPQNITFLLLSNDFELSCEKYVYVVKYLLGDNIFTVNELQKCLKDIMELDYQDATFLKTLERFTEILSS